MGHDSFRIKLCHHQLSRRPSHHARCALKPQGCLPIERGVLLGKNPNNFQQLLRQTNIVPSNFFAAKAQNSLEPLQRALDCDPRISQIIAQISSGTPPGGYSLENNLLLFYRRIVVPDSQDLKLNILQIQRNSEIVGHFG